MYDTQSHLGRYKKENSDFSFEDSCDFMNNNHEPPHIKYFDLKDLIENSDANGPSLSNTEHNISNSNTSVVSKYLPKQPPKPKLANNIEKTNLEFQTFSRVESNYDTNIVYPSNYTNTLPSDNVHSSNISRSNSVNNYASNPTIGSPLTKTEASSLNGWSTSEYKALPTQKSVPKFQNQIETLVANPRKSNESIKVITDPNEILSIDMNDPSYTIFEISETYSMNSFSSLQDFIKLNGFQYGNREMLEHNDEYEISEIILIF